VSFTPDINGDYKIKLVVNDGTSSSDAVYFTSYVYFDTTMGVLFSNHATAIAPVGTSTNSFGIFETPQIVPASTSYSAAVIITTEGQQLIQTTTSSGHQNITLNQWKTSTTFVSRPSGTYFDGTNVPDLNSSLPVTSYSLVSQSDATQKNTQELWNLSPASFVASGYTWTKADYATYGFGYYSSPAGVYCAYAVGTQVYGSNVTTYTLYNNVTTSYNIIN